MLPAWDPGSEAQVAFAVTRRSGIPSDEHWLRATAVDHRATWLVIGPEGGWTDTEIELALDQGWQPVTLGDQILRSSTASVTAAVSLVRWRERLAAFSS